MKSYQVMIFNAIILIALGIYGFIISGSPTALISSAIGLILFFISFPVKKENALAAHIGAGFTALATLIFFFMGIKRDNTLIIVMGVISLLASIFYFADFLKRRKEREENN